MFLKFELTYWEIELRDRSKLLNYICRKDACMQKQKKDILYKMSFFNKSKIIIP